MSDSSVILKTIHKRLGHIRKEPAHRTDILEQYVRHSQVQKEPIAGGIRKDIYERLIDIEPTNSESIAFFIRSTLGNIPKPERDPILQYLDSLHTYIDTHEDLLMGDDEIDMGDASLTKDQSQAVSLYREIYDLIGIQIENSNYVYNEIKRTYDGLKEKDLQKVKTRLELILARNEMIYLNMTYFAPYLYYLFMKGTYSADMTEKEINDWLDNIEDLFANSTNLRGINYSIDFILDQL